MLGARRLSLMTCTFCIAIASALLAQHSKVEATWLHRYVPALNERKNDLSSTSCHYRPIFDAGGSENTPQTVTRFAEVTLDSGGHCQTIDYDHEEEIYLILKGSAGLRYGDEWRGRDGGGRQNGWNRRPASRQSGGCLLLPPKLHGRLLQPEQARRKRPHPGGAREGSTAER